jgi:cytochrome c553
MQRKATIAVMLMMVMAVCATGASARLLDAQQAAQQQQDAEAPASVPCDETVHRGCAACRRAQGEGASEGGLVCVACTENAYLNERGACVCDPGYGAIVRGFVFFSGNGR